MDQRVAVIGAGPIGAALGILLAKKGFKVDVFEKRPNPIVAGDIESLSVSLALTARAMKYFELLGLEK